MAPVRAAKVDGKFSHGCVLALPTGVWQRAASSLPVLPGFLLFLAHGAAVVLRFSLRWLTPHDGSRLPKIVAGTTQSESSHSELLSFL